MRCVNSILLAGVLVSALAGCHSSAPKARGWSINMRGMADSYEKLLPYMYDSKRFNDPKNSKYISLHLKALNQNASDLDRHTARGMSGNDPLFKVGLIGLKTQIQKASESYFVESYEYSQRLLQSSVNYCNSCHTRTAIGPTFIKWDQFEDITAKLKPLDHANVLIATRQFPKAVSVLQMALLEASADKESNDEMLKKAMAVSLKNLKDPSMALEILKSVPKQKFSKNLQTDFQAWDAYLKKWENGQINISLRMLIAKRNTVGSHYIQSLHNSEILHNGLSTERTRRYRAKTYHALVKIYAKYPEQSSWNLPQTYYETCIYQDPGTKQALRCYYDLEARLKGFPPSKQTLLLSIEKSKLKKLKSIASKKPKKSDGVGGGFGFEEL